MNPQATTDRRATVPTTPTEMASVEWSVASRRPGELWRLAGWGDGSQALRFVVYSMRPPLTSNSAVPVVAQITEPLSPRRRALSVGGLLAAGAAAGTTLPSRPALAAAMIVVLLLVAAWVSTRALHGGVAADHVRLHDIVASRRGTGDGERSLRSLLASIDRGVELDVRAGRPGLVAMYARLGFCASDSTRARPGLIRMTRPRSTRARHEGQEPRP